MKYTKTFATAIVLAGPCAIALIVFYSPPLTIVPISPDNDFNIVLYHTPLPLPTPPLEHHILGWIPYWDQEAAVQSFKNNIDLIDFVGVFWYALSKNGSIVQYPYATIDQELVDIAHEHGVQVLAVLANLPTETEGGDWNAEYVEEVIATEKDRSKHISDIQQLLQQHSLDGINVDYEALRRDQKDNFTAFIKELSATLHADNKIVGISLMSKDSENNERFQNGSQAQDWETLSRYADHMYVMTYEEHVNTSEPGPPASIPWVSSILEYAITTIPRDKLYAGVPFYGYDWGQDGSTAKGLTHTKIQELIAEYDPLLEWDSDAKTPYYFYETGGKKHEVWYENADSIQAKLDVFDSLAIPNIAIWRLGGEDPGIWDIVRSHRNF